MSRSWKPGTLLLATWGALLGAESHAQAPSPPFAVVHTVAASDRAVPVEDTLDIATSGTYEITLTDLGAQLPTPAPLASVKLGITSGSSIVGTPLTGPGSTSFTASPGAYVIHVVGLPGNVPGSGPFGITVTNSSQNVVASFSGTLALPQAAAPSNEGILAGNFTVLTPSSYQVTLTDLQFPASLSTLTLAIVVQGGALVTTLPAAGSTTINLQPGVYEIFAVGQSTGAINAGLFGASVTPAGGGTPVYANTTAVGAVTLVSSPALAAGNYTLALADLKLPAGLAQLGAVVALNGQAAAQLTAAGSAPFTATANTYQVFALGVPGASGTGSYTLSLQPAGGGPAVLAVARAVSTPGGAVQAYSYDAQVPSGGGYTLNLADFALPAQFMSLSALAVQNGAALANPQQGAGAQSVIAAAGALSLLVFAQPAASGSLFGIDLEPSGTTNPVFSTTQGVGELFSAQEVNILSGGTYAVSVSDVGFPEPLANLAVVVTRGANQFGSIFVGGKFSFVATPGNYFLNFIAQPGGSDQAGTYAMSVAAAPAAPIVTFSSDATTVASGGTVNLIWTSQNATACTASGGWSVKQLATSGSMTSPALTSNTTFTLTCTGSGGSTAKSVQVTVTAATRGGGGGGDLSPGLLLALALVLSSRLAGAYGARLQ
jgi:plastocyanin